MCHERLYVCVVSVVYVVCVCVCVCVVSVVYVVCVWCVHLGCPSGGGGGV